MVALWPGLWWRLNVSQQSTLRVFLWKRCHSPHMGRSRQHKSLGRRTIRTIPTIPTTPNIPTIARTLHRLVVQHLIGRGRFDASHMAGRAGASFPSVFRQCLRVGFIALHSMRQFLVRVAFDLIHHGHGLLPPVQTVGVQAIALAFQFVQLADRGQPGPRDQMVLASRQL